MRYRMKRLLAELLSAVILLSLLPATAWAETTLADSGEINGFTYEWDDANKELTLTGDGELDLSDIAVTTDEVESVIIKGDVMIIGPRCFMNWRHLQTVVLPESLMEIGGRAFAYCSSLEMVELPEDLDIIGDEAFIHCSSLALRRLPKRLIEIGNRAFYECLSLALTELPESLESIGDYAFYYCKSLTNLTVPASLERIGRYAFHDCDDLTLRFLGMTAPTVKHYTLENVKEIQVPIGSTGYDAAHGWPEDKIQYVFSGGSTEENPYRIMDKAQLKAFRDYINTDPKHGAGEYFLLAADIDLGGEEWTPIGSDSVTGFQGTFDGGNFTIRGLSIDQPSSSGVGLFGYLKEGGTVKNLTVEGNVTGSSYVGGIVGQSMGGNIENCHNAAAVTGTNDSIGGVVGFNNRATVTNCYNTATVTGGYQYTGGIVGYDVGGTMTNCYNTATVTGHYLVGGIAGENSSSMVTNCYYLDTTQADRKATPKTAVEFASGEVAWLLQSGQGTQVWGQTVGSGTPELTASEDKKVFKITGKVEDQTDVVWYSNSSASLPAAEPAKTGFAFAGWSTEEEGTEADFVKGFTVSEDMTVYAVFVNKRVDGTGTLTMKDYTCGDTSVTPEAKSDTNTGAVTITYKQKGADDNTYTSDKPTTAGEYTVKAVFPANQNYNELTLTADFKITHQFNAGWEQTEDGEYHLCACGVGLLLETKELTEVPVGLKQNPDVDTVEEIEQVLVEKVATGDHYVIYDVELEAWTGDEWQIITPENLPEEGVAITIPYPKGTNSRYTFTVVHMFTTAGDGHVPGDTETLNATNEADGIHFTVKSFSPIIVGWKTGNLTVTVTDTGEGAGSAQQWQFRVELDDDTIDGTFGDMEFTGGVATFTLESGQSLTARDLPVGVKYTVTELEADQNGYTTTYTDDSGFITSEQDMVAAFINDKPAQAKPDKPSDDPDTPTDNPPDTPTDNPPDTPTDTPPDTPTSNNPNDTPKTGDESYLALWFSLIIVSLLGITVIILTPIIGRKKPVSAHGKHMRK